ncbi:MAG: diguanylate cyclase, partial [Myxococcales bacterium]|nr:diguanylate cyclase [Myxococcales bacterium]
MSSKRASPQNSETDWTSELSERKPSAEPNAEEKLKVLFESAPIGMVVTRLDGEFVEVNQAFCDMLRYSADDLIGMRLADVTHPSDLESSADIDEQLKRQDPPHFQMERRYIRRDGGVVHGLLKVGVVRDDQGNPHYLLGQVVDISERRRVEDRLRFAASRDALTGLPNRATFTRRLTELIIANLPFAVLFLDLDQFKVVNDSLGHEAGDRLLVQITRRLSNAVGRGHLVARHGGDEFTVIVFGAEDSDDAEEVAERIHVALTEPFEVSGQEIVTTTSIGIALGPRSYQWPQEVLRDADTAMYQAKAMGRGKHVLFDEDMRKTAVARLDLETEMRRGVERAEFVVRYEPIVSLADRRLAGLEALVRWNHPHRGFLSPAAFLSVAEETGQIIDIGRQVFQSVCQAVAKWQTMEVGLRPGFVSFNLSPRQFAHPDLITDLKKTFDETGAQPEMIYVEITETAMMDSGPLTMERFRELRDLGIRLSVDDFGTGYSSLAR